MSSKKHIRSMRFSDETIDIIDRQVGTTFTERFENLVTRCIWDLPEKEKQLADIQKLIDQKRVELQHLENVQQSLVAMRRSICFAEEYIDEVKKRACDSFRHIEKT